MAAPGTSAGPSRRRVRQSIAHMPSADFSSQHDKENATTDLSALKNQGLPKKRTIKKLRSKSIGPGGLDALQDTSGNSRKVSPPYELVSHFLTHSV